ncbi:MAG: hypothetical protein ABI859_00555 [Pseudomonadota bacterium]
MTQRTVRVILKGSAPAALLLLVSGQCAAFDWGLRARGGVVHSDNVAQAPAPLDDAASIGTMEVTGAVEHSTRSLSVDVEANHIYRYFFDNQYDAESQSQLRAALDWSPLRDFLHISVTDTYGQLALNPAEGLLPSQYENANVFTAGPTIVLPVTIDTRFSARGEYRVASYADSPLDTERKLGEVRLEHDLSRFISLFGSGTASRVDYDISGSSGGYDLNSVAAGFTAIGRKTSLGVSAGLDRLRQDGNSFDGATFQFDLDRRMSSSRRLFLSARREITDAADVFSLGQISDPALSGIRDVQITPQPLVRSQYRLGHVWTGSHLDVALLVGYITENFDAIPQDPAVVAGQDRNVKEASIDATYRFTGRTSLGGSVQILRERFDSGLSSDDLLTTVTYAQNLAGNLALELRAQHIRRDNSPRNFSELRAFAYLTYTFREIPGRGPSVFDRAFERRTERLRGTSETDDP